MRAPYDSLANDLFVFQEPGDIHMGVSLDEFFNTDFGSIVPLGAPVVTAAVPTSMPNT